jgi:hypothetical protein
MEAPTRNARETSIADRITARFAGARDMVQPMPSMHGYNFSLGDAWTQKVDRQAEEPVRSSLGDKSSSSFGTMRTYEYKDEISVLRKKKEMR